MTKFARHLRSRPGALTGFLILLLLASPLAHSQSACSSDDQPLPTALFERFINADCVTCWSDPATPPAPPDALVLDWIVPGNQGDDAPLAAAASSDAVARLASLQRRPAAVQDHLTHPITGWPGATLRVAYGPAVSNYVGVTVKLTLPPDPSLAWPLSAWVVLMEALPGGTEGSPVPRFLVRNVLQPSWNMGKQLSKQDEIIFNERRAMSFPAGAHPDRLRLAGWVQDAQGRILAAVQSTCPPQDKD